jgi:hypothetical protein
LNNVLFAVGSEEVVCRYAEDFDRMRVGVAAALAVEEGRDVWGRRSMRRYVERSLVANELSR